MKIIETLSEAILKMPTVDAIESITLSREVFIRFQLEAQELVFNSMAVQQVSGTRKITLYGVKIIKGET